MSSPRQRRDFTRVFASVAVELWPEQGGQIRGTLLDVTPTGMRIRCEGELALATACRIVLHPRDAIDGPTIEARGTVVRSAEKQLALALSEVPFEEFERLRGFLLENACAPEEIADELSERFGLAPGE